VTAKVRGIEFQQGIWRYHPRTKQFELFAEGGGNTWGLDFDRHGNAIAGTNWGGFAMLHQVQGGYYVKGFGKHGPLHNPHAYGYFDHVPHKDFKGGHVTCGGILYQGDSWPERFRNTYVAANLLSNALYWHTLTPKGSSFTAQQAGDLLVANDTWFRPVDCLTGPDGAVYVADWSDPRANHVDPVDNWDRSRGRIYRIQPPDKPYVMGPPIGKAMARQLVTLLDHPNSWQRGEARRRLAELRDPMVWPLLRQRIRRDKGDDALEALWALNVSGGLDDEAFLRECLAHTNPDVRTWTVRLLGDQRTLPPALRPVLVDLARNDPGPTVRSQLACTAKRFPAADGLPIIRALLERSEDVDDPHLPLLIWWAIEDKAISDHAAVLALLDNPHTWKLPLVRKALLERLGRRYLAEGKTADLQACAHLLETAPGTTEVRLLVSGMERALEGRTLNKVPEPLLAPLEKRWKEGRPDVSLVRLGLRLGYGPARTLALASVADQGPSVTDRVAYLEILGQGDQPADMAVFLTVLREGQRTDAERGAAMAALQRSDDPAVATTLLETYARLSPGLKSRARDVLLSRPASALALLRMVDKGMIDKKELQLDQLRGLARFQNAELTRLLERHYGRIAPQTTGEKIARLRSVAAIVSRGKGDPSRGQVLFKQHCANCHQLFGEGSKIGPDLMTVDRRNRDFLLLSIIDPGAVIRPEYIAFTVSLRDGRQLFGLVTEEAATVTVLDARNQRTVVPRKQIEELRASEISLMPEKLLDPLTDQQICDLLAYIQADGPKGQSGGP
jgi:putative heme-binding domain-containing protein